MKTKDLISILQKIDPDGDGDISIGNEDIWFVDTEPSYYDGCLQILKRDDPQNPESQVLGIEFKSSGHKIVIHNFPIRSMLYDNPNFPVTYESEYSRKLYEDRVGEWKKESKDWIEKYSKKD